MALGTIALFLLILIPLRTLFLIGALDPSQERVSTALVEAEAVADRISGTEVWHSRRVSGPPCLDDT